MNIPKHIVLFPDGNRRWAKEHGFSIQEGYLKGKDKFNDFLRWSQNAGVKTVTVFGFSSENWQRPKEQVDFLMYVFEKYLGEGIDEFNKEGVRVSVIGQKEKLSDSLKKVIENVEAKTAGNQKLRLNLAVSYGGRWDILQATQKMMQKGIEATEITESILAQHLCLADQDEPDFIIRAGGEIRLSNFVLWQAAYAELYFSPKLWPDFSKEDLDLALEEFDKRKRRFGK